MTTAQDYQMLGEKLSQLQQRRAVLLDREAAKKTEREAIEAELLAAGVDTQNLDGEVRRLEKQVDEDYQTAKQLVETFDRELTAVTQSSK